MDRDDRIKDEKIMMTMIIIKLLMMIQARREKQCDDGKTAAMGALECSGEEVGPTIIIFICQILLYLLSSPPSLSDDRVKWEETLTRIAASLAH